MENQTQTLKGCMMRARIKRLINRQMALVQIGGASSSWTDKITVDLYRKAIPSNENHFGVALLDKSGNGIRRPDPNEDVFVLVNQFNRVFAWCFRSDCVPMRNGAQVPIVVKTEINSAPIAPVTQTAPVVETVSPPLPAKAVAHNPKKARRRERHQRHMVIGTMNRRRHDYRETESGFRKFRDGLFTGSSPTADTKPELVPV